MRPLIISLLLAGSLLAQPYGREPLGRGAFGRSTQTAVEAAAWVGILDSLAALGEPVLEDSAGAWCLFERLTVDYTGDLALIRRDSDNEEAPIPYVEATGYIDLDSLESFLDGTTGACVTLYDQLGSNDLTMATAANQPDITLAVHGIYPALEFLAASAQCLTTAGNALDVSTESVTALVVCYSEATGASGFTLITHKATIGNVSGYGLWISSTLSAQFFTRKTITLASAVGATTIAGGANAAWRTLTGTWETADDSAKVYLDNGVMDGSAVNTNNNNITVATKFSMGANTDGTAPLTGRMVMGGVWTGTQPTSITRAGIAAHFAGLE